ncbi:YycC family protein [Salibacterium qingdaonense]|uniref:YycC-like protein n=1 Tax=Salibacterium qingdaonense TaxID=266892 RepID=A0A1I4R0F0_9BACI|nr:YycC family protein [Salibacterium qingdaonense]SFM45792.1 YycC-like protein [Salibacterium qingdaonense]
MRPNQFSAETARKVAEKLNMPIEHIVHTPPQVIMEKISELEKKEEEEMMEKNNK